MENVTTNAGQKRAVEFRYSHSAGFADALRQLGAALVVSTYQANKLLVVRATDDGLSILVRSFERPMGLAIRGDRIALGTRDQIWEFRDAPDIARRLAPPGQHDACYLPRSSHVTGDIGVHELAWVDDELWLVNTRFSCLCTLHPDFSFVPRWRPSFISELAAEDRCHLNGLALVDGRPRYVTALGESNTKDGWRANKPQGGCLIDIASGEFVVRGLSMPHSPRWHEGTLWVLESGTGQLQHVEAEHGRRQTIADVPGFARGLALTGPFAWIGLSKIRTTSAMDGVPLAARREQLKCGVAVVDTRNRRLVGLLEFESAVEEIFDVQILPGQRFPELFGFQADSIRHTFVVPPAQSPLLRESLPAQ